MTKYLHNRFLFPIFLSLAGIYYLWIFFASEITPNQGDGQMHYLISHWAAKHPLKFLDHWGKPLFSLVAHPFTYLGRVGVAIMNVVFLLTSSWLLYRIAKNAQLKYAYAAGVFLLFAPIAIEVAYSGLTEILFCFLFVSGSYLWTKGRITLGALVFSFLPFSRSEGMFMIPLLALFLLVLKQWRGLPYLLFGFVIYGFVGWYALGDFFWYFNDNPYRAPDGIYGSGSIFHFIVNYKPLIGPYILIAVALGLVPTVIRSLKWRQMLLSEKVVFLMIAAFLMVLSMHSILWWQGIRGSAGLIRVLLTTLPGLLLIALIGLGVVGKVPKAGSFLALILVTVAVVNQMRSPKLPFYADEYHKTQMALVNWYKESEFNGRRIICADPVIRGNVGLDPFDSDQVKTPGYVDKNDLARGVSEGELFIWDGKFCPVENQFPDRLLLDHPNYKLVKQIHPEHPFNFGEEAYKILVFEKYDKAVPKVSGDVLVKELLFNDVKQKSVYCQGKDCFERLEKGHQYSRAIEFKIGEYLDATQGDVKDLLVSWKIRKVLGEQLILVLEQNKDGKQLSYLHKDLTVTENEWSDQSHKFQLTVDVDPESVFKCYVYTNNEAKLELNSLKVELVDRY